MIHPTEFITFPRSGHHLLIDLLQAYFGAELHYCEMYLEPEKRFDQCPTTNAQKNHDFELDTSIVEGRRYVVQIRDPLESIASYYEYQGAHGVAVPDKDEFCKKTLDYCSKIIAKWIYSPVPSRLIVHYRDLIDLPLPTLARVVEHMINGPSDVPRLRDVIDIVGVRSYFGLRK